MKNKKHIPINDDIHIILKKYCKEKGIVIKVFVEKLIIEKLEINGVCIQTYQNR